MSDKIERTTTIKAPIDRVWEAISDHKQFGEWFRVALDQPFEAGKPSTGKMTYPGYEGYPWYAQVTAVEPPRRLAFEWVPGSDVSGDLSQKPRTKVEFRLEPEGDGTRVTITETGFDKLPEAYRDSALRENTEGWEIQSENLREFAEARVGA